MMGSPETEADRNSNEGPQTVVTLTQGFWMSRFEVTQQEYLDGAGENPSGWTGELNAPVENVAWSNATNYCHLLTESEQASGGLPTGYVYRLPTEAEWEYACRAGTTTALYYGDDPTYSFLENYAWFVDNSGFRTHAVGQLEPNDWSLYDMQGNVYEWCWDHYAGSHPGGQLTDPTGPTSGSSRVIRGAGNEGVPEAARSANRGSSLPFFTSRAGGFRVVLGAPLE